MTPFQLFLGILVAFAAISVIFLFPKLRNFISRHLGALMAIVYFAGFVVYLIGHYHGAQSLISAALMSAISALEMFASHSDLVEMSESLKEGSTLYMVCFAIVHFAAVMLALFFVLELFGKRLVSKIEAMTLRAGGHGKKLYLIDGTDENAVTLARSLPEEENCRIVFCKSAIDLDVKELSFLDMVISGMRKRNRDVCEDLGNVLFTPVPFAVAAAHRDGWFYRSILKMINAYESAEVFLISPDSEINTAAALNLATDIEDSSRIRLFTGVNKSEVHSWKLSDYPNIHPIGSFELVVDDLIESTPLLDGNTDKHTLLIGFSYTGKKCLSALAEKGYTKVDIADPQLSLTSGEYFSFNQELLSRMDLRLVEADFKSNRFWDYLKDNIESINNVVVFNYDDAKSEAQALKVLEYARTRKDITDFRVFYSCRDASDKPVENTYRFGTLKSLFNYNRLK